MWAILKALNESVIILLVLCCAFFALRHVGSYQTHTPPFPHPHIEGKVLTTGLPRKSPPQILNIYIMY